MTPTDRPLDLNTLLIYKTQVTSYMKKLYTLLLFIIAALPMSAQQIFVEKGNNTQTIEFAKLDKITFSGTTVNILQTDGTTTSAAMSDINRIHFSNYNSIDNLKATTGELINFI